MDFGAQMVLSSAAFCLTPDIVAPSSRIGAGTPQTDSPIGLGLRAVVASSGDKDGNLVKSYNDRWEEKGRDAHRTSGPSKVAAGGFDCWDHLNLVCGAVGSVRGGPCPSPDRVITDRAVSAAACGRSLKGSDFST